MRFDPANEIGAGATARPCIPLRAGPWVLRFQTGDLRYIRHGSREVVRRIYGAVRDENWDTVEGTISDLRTHIGPDGFEIRYTSTHRKDSIHFVWDAVISGRADGTVRFEFSGESRSVFRRNRIGLCVLHPMSCAGVRCRVGRCDGTQEDLRLPKLVEPAQPIVGVSDIRTFSHEIEAGVWASLEFEGERFEMEDQRNWIDASFKIYGTPLNLAFPVEISAGTRIRQAVTLRIQGPWTDPGLAWDEEPEVRVHVGCAIHPLPMIGLSMASHGRSLTPREVSILRALDPAHLRADICVARPDWSLLVSRASSEAFSLGVPLELGLHVPVRGAQEVLRDLAAFVRERKVDIVRILVFQIGAPTTTTAVEMRVRDRLGHLGVPIGVGTDADFYQLNQFRPPDRAADFVHWSMNPQVHAADLLSVAETPAAIAAQLHSAAAYFPGKPLIVSPVTLKPRRNPVATREPPAESVGGLPSSVDPRQVSPFAAAWTLAAIKHLAEGGAAAVTLFETTGWRGVMECEGGCPCPELFASQPGQVFPLYHAIAEITGFRGGRVLSSSSSDSRRVESLVLMNDQARRVYLANLTDRPQSVRVSGDEKAFDPPIRAWACALVGTAAPVPEMCECLPGGTDSEARDSTVVLPPFGLVRLESERRGPFPVEQKISTLPTS